MRSPSPSHVVAPAPSRLTTGRSAHASTEPRRRLAGGLVAASGALVVALASPVEARAEGSCLAALSDASTTGTAADVFARGRAAYEGKRFGEAASLFRAVALAHPDDDLASRAASLSLDALNQAGPPGSTACLGQMVEDARRYVETICGAKPIAAREADCDTFGRIVAVDARLEAEALFTSATKEKGRAARRLASRAGDRFVSAYRGRAVACQKKLPSCDRAEELLYDAAAAYRLAGDAGQAIAVLELLVDPANGLSETTLAKKAVLDEAQGLLALGEVARALPLFERFVRESPKASEAADAATNAFVIHLATGDFDGAEKDADFLTKTFGAKDRALVERTRLALLEALVEHEAWRDVLSLAKAFESGEPITRVRARGAVAMALEATGKARDADVAFEALAHVSPGDFLEPGGAGASQPALRDVAKVAILVGRAHLHAARKKQREAMALHLDKRDASTLGAKRKAIEEAERAYREILSIAPVPPPRETVAAASEVARMRGQLWGEAYVKLGPEAAAPLEREALGAYEMCQALAVKLEVPGPAATSCIRWLERHDPAHHPPLTEIAPRPTLDAAGLPPPSPLDRDGEPREPSE
jgi:tetratricopeptide (TPR) repeat protein